MKKSLFLLCLAATAWLISAGPGLTGDALGAPPEYGIIEGNTWTNQFSMNEKDYLTYSFSPVPDVIMLGATQVYSLKPGNTMAWKDAGLQMYSIIEFDYSELGEDLIADSPVYESQGDSSFTFSRPGLFSVHLLNPAGRPIMMLTIQVTDGGEWGALEAQE